MKPTGSGRQRVSFLYVDSSVARFTGFEMDVHLTWGSAAFHPRLYALASFASWALKYSKFWNFRGASAELRVLVGQSTNDDRSKTFR